MSSRHKGFLIGLAAILFLSIFLGHMKPADSKLKDVVREEHASFDPPVLPTPQHRDMRRWVLRDYQKIISIPSPQVLKAPGRARITSDRTIFVLDMDDHSVKVFSPSGTALSTIPDPNGNSVDFALSHDGTVWFADPNGLLTGVTKEAKKTPDPSERLRAMRVETIGNKLLLLLIPESNEMFAFYSDAESTVVRFGHMLEHQKTTGAAISGEIAVDEASGTLFHAATYAGILDSYDSTGALRYIVQTIAPLPLPTIEVTENGRRIPFAAPYSGLSMCVYGNDIYLLTEVPPGGKIRKRAIDVYNKGDGSYQYSVKAPEGSEQISISQGMLYTISRSGLTVFRVNPPL